MANELDLDQMELDARNRCAFSPEDCLLLIAAARELAEIKGALEWLDERASLIDPRDEDDVYEPSRAVEMARELGWTGKAE